ncbi:uncharacterized protein PGTG_18308 [Puccinia graminis f. sp. tritici CRL 75-36-700-3]|uniref:Uncharacterized protein n=1 Tax=Puccinia graminis f. sp. tritici (strain CRL 75-36-700-3 / race SCCL) TaxID=418459 RepID=E3L7F8_PUCGT|nr:uncharacterized protein PGTG_18308 [Puccinia graminis f. sp. tritici CRL 75-36-700-3]EFP92483.2 hypothetical protein PGTG_18308 [Puccinia graminis f. sp. tritici CRL 75-36-700-3]
MYHQNQRPSSHQELIPSSSTSPSPSPSRNQQQQPQQQQQLRTKEQKQHAFGADSDDDDEEENNNNNNNNNSDSDEDDGLGFQVYKDQASTPRYLNVNTGPPTPSSAQSNNMTAMQQQTKRGGGGVAGSMMTGTTNRGPPSYRYPPEDSQQHSTMHSQISPTTMTYKPAPSDLVQMPALGSDWTKDESKRDKDWEGKDTLIDKTKWLDRKQKIRSKKQVVDSQFRDFLAGRRRLGGWFTRVMALVLLLFSLLLAVLLIYFLVPRVPEVAYNNETTFTGDSANGLSFQTLEPVRFEFNGKINLAMTAKSSYVQPKTSIITVIIKDLSSAGNPVEVARGSNSDSLSISNKEYTPFSVDLNFRYSANSSKDPVWTAWHEACGHKWPGKEDRPKLQIGIIVLWSLKGRAGTFEERTILNDFMCPVELPASAA